MFVLSFVYKVIPAPSQGKRAKGAKGSAGRFANGLEAAINELASEGWEYVRAESLPSVERKGLTRRRSEEFQNVLVFRKPNVVSETNEQIESKVSSFFRPKKKIEPAMTAAAVAAPTLIATPSKPEPEPAIEPLIVSDPIMSIAEATPDADASPQSDDAVDYAQEALKTMELNEKASED